MERGKQHIQRMFNRFTFFCTYTLRCEQDMLDTFIREIGNRYMFMSLCTYFSVCTFEGKGFHFFFNIFFIKSIFKISIIYEASF